MNAREKIRTLELQRDLELRSAARHASRLTKTLSPTRTLRKNMPAALGVSLVAGLLIAPRLRGKSSTPDHPRRRLRVLAALLLKFFPQFRPYLPYLVPPNPANAAAPAPSPEPATPSAPQPAHSPLTVIFHRLAQEINWPLLLAPLLTSMIEKLSPPPQSNPQTQPAESYTPEIPH